jgi:hypothetical protein
LAFPAVSSRVSGRVSDPAARPGPGAALSSDPLT